MPLTNSESVYTLSYVDNNDTLFIVISMHILFYV